MGRPAKGKTRQTDQTERRAQIARSEARSARDRIPQRLGLARARLSARLTKAQRDVAEEAGAIKPGQEHMSILVGLLLALTDKETESVRRLDRELDRARKGSPKFDGDRLEIISQHLQEIRRHMRSVRGVLKDVSGAARVSSQIDIGTLPDEIRVVVDSLWADVGGPDEATVH